MAKRATTKEKNRTHFVKEWRKHRRLTQYQAAEKIGMSRENLSKLERGEISFTADSLARVAKAYGCQESDLFRAPADNSAPAPAAKAKTPENTSEINDLKLVLALFEMVMQGLTRNDLVASELAQSLELSYEAARERGLSPQDCNELQLLVETLTRRLLAVSA